MQTQVAKKEKAAPVAFTGVTPQEQPLYTRLTAAHTTYQKDLATAQEAAYALYSYVKSDKQTYSVTVNGKTEAVPRFAALLANSGIPRATGYRWAKEHGVTLSMACPQAIIDSVIADSCEALDPDNPDHVQAIRDQWLNFKFSNPGGEPTPQEVRKLSFATMQATEAKPTPTDAEIVSRTFLTFCNSVVTKLGLAKGKSAVESFIADFSEAGPISLTIKGERVIGFTPASTEGEGN